MKVISTKKFILFALATVVFLTPNSMCLNEAMKSRLQSREDSDDKYYKIKENILEEKQRSLDFDEMEEWGSKDVIKMNPFTGSKMPNSVANLPLRFGRNYPEERSIKPFANLPLRFGRAFEENIPNHAPKVSHRLGRSPLVKGSSQSLLNLPQRFGKSLAVNLPQDIPESEPDTKSSGNFFIGASFPEKQKGSTEDLLSLSKGRGSPRTFVNGSPPYGSGEDTQPT